jgi:hypothetical protein
MAKSRLGRGLDGLLKAKAPAPTAEVAEPAGPTTTVAIGRVDPNPHQPRQDVDAAELEHLAASIREHGILQPLVVRPHRGDTQREVIHHVAARRDVQRLDVDLRVGRILRGLAYRGELPPLADGRVQVRVRHLIGRLEAKLQPRGVPPAALAAFRPAGELVVDPRLDALDALLDARAGLALGDAALRGKVVDDQDRALAGVRVIDQVAGEVLSLSPVRVPGGGHGGVVGVKLLEAGVGDHILLREGAGGDEQKQRSGDGTASHGGHLRDGLRPV